MALLGFTKTGRVWPGQLEAYGLDAPAEPFVADPLLPELGVDPRFPSDRVVIPRGRLVGVKGTASVSGGAIINQSKHETVLTLADGLTVAPIGYAPYNIFRDWQGRTKGERPIFARSHAISLPYIYSTTAIESANNAYGALTQGDKVTAYAGHTKTATADPTLKGLIVKWVPRKVYIEITDDVDGTDVPLSAATIASIKPVVLQGVKTDGAQFTKAEIATANGATKLTWNDTDDVWIVDMGAACTSIVYEVGMGPEMIAGEVLGLETTADLPGYLKWVGDNFGAWELPRLHSPLSTATTQKTCKSAAGDYTVAVVTGATNAFTLGTAAVGVRVDASKSIDVYLTAGVKYIDANGDEQTLADGGDGTGLMPKATFEGSDYTMGLNYTINAITGVIQFFGVTDTDGTALDAADVIVKAYVQTSFRPSPVFGQGQYGLTDGSVKGLEPQYDVTNSLGIMRVAIH